MRNLIMSSCLAKTLRVISDGCVNESFQQLEVHNDDSSENANEFLRKFHDAKHN